MNERQRLILKGAAADIARLRVMELHEDTYHDWDAITENADIKNAKMNTTRCLPSRWLGRDMSPSDHVLNSRAYKALEAAGLVVRHALGFGEGQNTHIELTEAGTALVATFAEAAVDG